MSAQSFPRVVVVATHSAGVPVSVLSPASGSVPGGVVPGPGSLLLELHAITHANERATAEEK